ncbi:MAG: hypothetical protein WC346_09195 [Methanogenium sp.]|jgi:hypothetical protein
MVKYNLKRPSDLENYKKRVNSLEYFLERIFNNPEGSNLQGLKIVKTLLDDSKLRGYNVRFYEKVYKFVYDVLDNKNNLKGGEKYGK